MSAEKNLRRRKPDPAAAKRMRELRERRKLEATAPQPSEKFPAVAVATTQPVAPAATNTATTGESQAPAAPQQVGPTLAEKEALVAKALAGTVEAVADTIQMVKFDPKAPHLGHDRARLIGDLWAPVLAPYINEDVAKWLPLALAAGGTANAFYGWAAEVHAWQDVQARKGPLSVVREGAAQ